MSTDTSRSEPAVRFVHSTIEDMEFKAGRRSWIRYRDLGIKEATSGQMSAQIMHIEDAIGSKPTGWHYHTAPMQFNYVIEGWVKFEFADRGVVIVKAGESIMIPGGMVHQELCSSDPMRLLEIFTPAAFETFTVATPATAIENAADYGTVEPVQATG